MLYLEADALDWLLLVDKGIALENWLNFKDNIDQTFNSAKSEPPSQCDKPNEKHQDLCRTVDVFFNRKLVCRYRCLDNEMRKLKRKKKK